MATASHRNRKICAIVAQLLAKVGALEQRMSALVLKNLPSGNDRRRLGYGVAIAP